jgi:predicted anti-sigma-YlaC factor YlaD
MTGFRLQPRTCERAREWASLRLDGELSELEQALLDAHLARCAGCSAYARDVSGATAALRDAELVLLPEPIALPFRRRRAGVSARALQASTAVAAVLAAAVGLGTFFGSLGGPPATVGASVTRLARNSIASGPSTEADALLKTPRLAMIHAQMGVGKQRGVRFDI